EIFYRRRALRDHGADRRGHYHTCGKFCYVDTVLPAEFCRGRHDVWRCGGTDTRNEQRQAFQDRHAQLCAWCYPDAGVGCWPWLKTKGMQTLNGLHAFYYAVFNSRMYLNSWQPLLRTWYLLLHTGFRLGRRGTSAPYPFPCTHSQALPR